MKLEVGIEKQESWGDTDWKMEIVTMQKFKGVEEPGVCFVNEDNMGVS